jgi:hypothetical protein
MGYNLLMPISKFAEKLARSLTDYLTEDNPTTLDLSHTLDMAQQALGTVTSALSASYTYFWSKPATAAVSVSPYGTTPQQYQATGSGGGGKAGIERAREIARLFRLVYNEEELAYALSSDSLIGGIASRRSELLTSAFNVVDPGNKLPNQITREDCDHILKFIEKRADFLPSRAGARVLEVIKLELEITDEMVIQEEASLKRGDIQIPADEDEGFEIIQSNAYQSYDYSTAPDDLWKPQEALMKLIYDETQTLKESLPHDVFSPFSTQSMSSTPISIGRSSTHSPYKN